MDNDWIRMKKYGILLCIFVLSISSYAQDNNFKKGVDAYKSGNNKNAFSFWLKAANQGNAIAQFNLGTLYENGEGVSQDYSKAFEWYQKAANQGNVDAQFNLGSMYYNGNGVGQNYKKALEWWQKAANHGDSDAQYWLGIMYENGEGVAQDFDKSFVLFQKAANLGHTDAQYALGKIYLEGDGERQYYDEALEWFKKAANLDNDKALFSLGWMYFYGKGVNLDYSKALDYFQKSANKGNADAQNHLGAMYIKGIGVPQNNTKAFEWMQKSANQENVEAQRFLGLMYYYGSGVIQDYNKAIEWYTKAANQGDSEAQNFLGAMYANGDGTVQNHKKAFELFQKAANQGNVDAQFNLGSMYFYGNGVVQNYKKAYEWYQKAANNGYSEAQNSLGDMYFDGYGVDQNYAKALEWYQKAANNGHANAQCILGTMYLGGIGVAKNQTMGMEWLAKSADNGNCYAMNSLGWQYLIEEGGNKDYQKAENLFKNAIEKNELYPYPYSNLALLYAQRDKNYKEALRYSDMAVATLTENSSPTEQCDIYGERGQIYFWKGDLENAEKMLEKCLNLNPDFLKGDHDFAKMMASRFGNDVDNNIITNPSNNRNTFAVIIGNEKYKNEVGVPFANNDSRIFYQYVDKTLGVPADQIRLIENAGYNDIRMAVNWLVKAMQVCRGKGKAIVYYAGHGIPNESDLSSYLLPVDGIGNDPGSAYSLKELYDRLGSVEAQSVTVFLDACFCGSKREEGMLTSARGIALKVKQSSPQGNMIIFSAAQGDETAYPYEEKRHGMFTYYLLKKLQETKGNVTLGTLSDYLAEEVSRQSFVKNNKIQSPTVNVSAILKNNWRNMKLR